MPRSQVGSPANPETLNGAARQPDLERMQEPSNKTPASFSAGLHTVQPDYPAFPDELRLNEPSAWHSAPPYFQSHHSANNGNDFDSANYSNGFRFDPRLHTGAPAQNGNFLHPLVCQLFPHTLTHYPFCRTCLSRLTEG